MDYNENTGIDIPFGAFDSELKGWTARIPEGFTAEIKGDEIIVRENESEDERIRKGLIKLLTVASGAYLVESTGIKKDSYLAYLEKQKEQKPIVLSNKFEIALEEFLMNSRDVSEKTFAEDVKEYADRLREIVKNEQKPAEWSEEDEDNLKRVIRVLEDNDSDWKELTDWLKSLRLQKNCSDCSKHLEGYIDGRTDAERILLNQYGILVMPDGELRMKPRWKPSEEQMKVFHNVLVGQRGAWGKDTLTTMGSLYEKLKSL